MTDYQKYINALRKCAQEHDNDRTSTGHIIVSNLCRDTADMIRDDKAEIEILKKRVKELEALDQEPKREFIEIVVEYPKTCDYPEWEGKPYYSIAFREDGQTFIGYGTYNPAVLSRYIRQYFLGQEEEDGEAAD